VGIDPKIGASLGLLALNSFILTSLDTATRLARYQLQEFTDMKLDRYTATAIGVGAARFLVFYKTGGKAAWQLIRPVFGGPPVVAASPCSPSRVAKLGLNKPNGFFMEPCSAVRHHHGRRWCSSSRRTWRTICWRAFRSCWSFSRS
jgi:carbon starvation protein